MVEVYDDIPIGGQAEAMAMVVTTWKLVVLMLILVAVMMQFFLKVLLYRVLPFGM